MKHTIIILLICLASCLTSQAQRNRYIKTDPSPYYLTPYYSDSNDTGLKEVITIFRREKDGFKNDTTSHDYYNQDGKLVKIISYDDNIPTRETIREYKNGNLKTLYSNSFATSKDRYNLITTYQYNKYDKKVQSIGLYINKATRDTSENSPFGIYHYKDDLFISAESGTHKGDRTFINSLDSLEYDEEKKPILFKYKINKLFGHIKYTYNKDGHLINETEILYSTLIKEEKKYEYKGGKLIREIESRLLVKGTPDTITEYEYDKKGNLIKLTSTHGEKKQVVTFTYANTKRTSMTVVTNTHNVAFLKVHWRHIYRDGNEEIIYKETLKYDDHGNMILKKGFIDNELTFELEYLVKYW